MRTITLLIFCLGFLLLRPYEVQMTGLKYGGDDDSYFAHATALVYGNFPSYQYEYNIYGSKKPEIAVGCGDLATPFVFVFSFIDRLTHNPIVNQRNDFNDQHSWSLFGFVFASLFYLWLACLLLYLGLGYFFKTAEVKLAIILLLLVEGIPLFVFRRPVYSHIYEFFTQSALLFILLYKNKFEDLVENNRKIKCLLIIFTGILAPFVLIGVICLLSNMHYPVKKQLLILFIPCLLDFYMAVNFVSQGGWYGYRYFLFSFMPIIIVPFTYFISRIFEFPQYRKIIWIVLILIALPPLLSMLAYEGNSSNLTLSLIPGNDWNNLSYELQVWKTLVQHPAEFIIAIIKGGPLYLVYLTATLFHLQVFLPAIVLEKYSSFQLTTLIKVLILYLAPFAFLFLWEKTYK